MDEYTRLLQQITITAKRVNSSKAVKGFIKFLVQCKKLPKFSASAKTF